MGIPEIREQLNKWRNENGIEDWDKENQLELALNLLEQPIAEDKLAGILYLENYR